MTIKLLKHILATVTLCAALSAVAYPTSHYSAQSVLAEGKWAKVQVDTSGIFQITYQQLQDLGFDNPRNVTVWGYGAVVASAQQFESSYPDDLTPTPVVHTSDGRILFYGESDVRGTVNTDGSASFVRNYYDTKSYYFITDSRQDANQEVVEYHDAEGDTLSFSYAISLIEREVQNIGRGGVYYHGPILGIGDSENFTFNIRDFDTSTRINGQFRYEAAVKTGTSVRIPITASDNVAVKTNSSTASGVSNSNVRLYCAASGLATYTATDDKPLDNTDVTFTLTIPSTFKGSYAAIDKAYVVYPQKNTLKDKSQLSLNFKADNTKLFFTLSDVDENTIVWNVTSPASIVNHKLSIDDNGVAKVFLGTALASNAAKFVAFNPDSEHLPVKVIGAVDNQNIHGSHCPDMIIVSTQENLAAAMELGQIHSDEQGLDVLVVSQQQAQNEFASGIQHPGAIRRMAKMFYDRNPSKLKYLVLYGSTHWDNRGLIEPRDNHLVCFQCESLERARETTTNYCSDFYFGMLADGYNHSNITLEPTQIAVGRIPVINSTEALSYNNKVRHILQNLPTSRQYMQTLMSSDKGDNYGHTIQLQKTINIMKSERDLITNYRADRGVYEKVSDYQKELTSLFSRVLTNGVGYFCYMGHGNLNSIAGGNGYDINSVNTYSYKYMPLAALFTCDVFPIDRYSTSLAKAMILKTDGGASAVLAACRSVYMEHNKDFSYALSKIYAKAEYGDGCGDLVKKARNYLIATNTTTGLGENTLCYNLCGDPALPVGAPTYDIVVDRIGDKQYEKTDTVEVEALKSFNVKAHIADGDKIVDIFSGSAVIDVFDTPITRTDYTSSSGDTAWVCDEILLASIPVPVSKGVIDANIALPASLTKGCNRMVITAVDSDGLLAANRYGKLSISDNSLDGFADNVDIAAPVIEEFYINTPSFSNGDIIDSQFTVHAVVAPSPIGLSRNIWNVKPSSLLVLDESENIPEAIIGMQIDDDGKYILEYKVDKITDGNHSLTLVAVNNAGVSVEESIEFTIVGGGLREKLITDIEGPARTAVSIDFEKESSASCRRLIIKDSAGRTVRSVKNCELPFKWNLCDNNGDIVEDGMYTITALLEDLSRFGYTEKLEIIVITQ